MELSTSRPRVIGWLRSAAILDGDWGTSICYVLGIAFFLAGYSAGWHLLMMLVLTGIIAFNYTTICRLYPNGGGVYSSVSHRNRTIAVIGALLLSADYVVTASLSVLDACHYLDLGRPELWAVGIILCIGLLNWFGPRHAGSVAIAISAATLVVLAILMAVAAPSLGARATLQPMPEGLSKNWSIFVGIILSISGIEAVSNMTGLMRDPEADSRKAILSVFAKITIATVVLGLAMLAIPNMSAAEHKEDMIRFLGEFYIGPWFGPIVGAVLGFLLISAGNTAINDLISIQFLMSVDGELPRNLRGLNKYGVPVIPLVAATIVPVIVLLFVHDVINLASLYAIGVVGAIAINLGSTSTDKTIQLRPTTRYFMLASAALLFLVEVTIAFEKTKAVIFAGTVLFMGLAARQIARRQAAIAPAMEIELPALVSKPVGGAFTSKMMVAVRGGGEKLLRQACADAKFRQALLFVMHVKQLAVSGNLPDKIQLERTAETLWMEQICNEYGIPYRIISMVSPEVGYTIAEQAATLGVERLVLGATQRNLVEQALRGDVIRSVSALLPEEIQLVIYRA
jgi:amino acid transporter